MAQEPNSAETTPDQLAQHLARDSAAVAGPEVTKLADRMYGADAKRRVVNFGVTLASDLDPDAPRATAEEVAAEINRVNEWMADPRNEVASRLGGEAMLLEDSIHCLLHSSKLAENGFVPVEPSAADKAEAKRLQRTLDMYNELAKKLHDDVAAHPRAAGGTTAQAAAPEGLRERLRGVLSLLLLGHGAQPKADALEAALDLAMQSVEHAGLSAK